MTAGPAELGRLRDVLLQKMLGQLEADPAVTGAALIGSLGRGRFDHWSDIDLLILMDDADVARFADAPAERPWGRAELLSDGRHNSPAGATSVGATHLRSRLPLAVDLHVHPAARMRWPADALVVFERRPIAAAARSFDQLNADGPRQPPTPKTADEVRRIRLSYVPIAGKYIGRRSPRAAEMISFLGRGDDGPPAGDLAATDPAGQLRVLRGIAAGLADPSWTWLADAVGNYLDLVEATL